MESIDVMYKKKYLKYKQKYKSLAGDFAMSGGGKESKTQDSEHWDKFQTEQGEPLKWYSKYDSLQTVGYNTVFCDVSSTQCIKGFYHCTSDLADIRNKRTSVTVTGGWDESAMSVLLRVAAQDNGTATYKKISPYTIAAKDLNADKSYYEHVAVTMHQYDVTVEENVIKISLRGHSDANNRCSEQTRGSSYRGSEQNRGSSYRGSQPLSTDSSIISINVTDEIISSDFKAEITAQSLNDLFGTQANLVPSLESNDWTININAQKALENLGFSLYNIKPVMTFGKYSLVMSNSPNMPGCIVVKKINDSICNVALYDFPKPFWKCNKSDPFISTNLFSFMKRFNTFLGFNDRLLQKIINHGAIEEKKINLIKMLCDKKPEDLRALNNFIDECISESQYRPERSSGGMRMLSASGESNGGVGIDEIRQTRKLPTTISLHGNLPSLLPKQILVAMIQRQNELRNSPAYQLRWKESQLGANPTVPSFTIDQDLVDQVLNDFNYLGGERNRTLFIEMLEQYANDPDIADISHVLKYNKNWHGGNLVATQELPNMPMYSINQVGEEETTLKGFLKDGLNLVIAGSST